MNTVAETLHDEAADRSPWWTPIGLAERGLVPDALIRHGIRRLSAQRLREERAGGDAVVAARQATRLEAFRRAPIAVHTDAANQQHYELPTRFFELCLGRRLKYSACYWDAQTVDLDAAEERMLALYGERALLADGQEILELGCGWGSLTLWMAEHYPRARITALSNSRTQRAHIEAQCAARGLDNVTVLTRDVNVADFEPGRFDRVVSVEMFEHVRNYSELFARIGRWLRADGCLFVHIFCHRELMYPFETDGNNDWMARHFFTGGLMPASDTFRHAQDTLKVETQWLLSGSHYQRTADAWLQRHDAHGEEIMALMRETYGAVAAARWNQRWRIFWMACAELFGYAGGDEWAVAHYRFRPR